MPRAGFEEVTLLTGLSSFLAKRLARTILDEDPRAFVYAVVRGDGAAELEPWLGALPARTRERLVLLEGDPSAIDLGLSGSELCALASEVDRIHHTYGTDDLALDRAEIERRNIGSMFEILETARACSHLQCLVVHSTIEVAGNAGGIFTEDDLDVGQSFSTTCAETRARAERVARAAMASLPVAVLRHATILGDSQTGEIDRLEGPYLFFVLIATSPPEIALPLPGAPEAELQLVPVDFAARASAFIARSREAAGKTFHLVDPNPRQARAVFEAVARLAGRPPPLGTFPTPLVRALVRTPGVARFSQNPRAFVEQLAMSARFDAKNARALLDHAGVACPPFETYVERLVAHVQDRLRERRERPARPTPLSEREPGPRSEQPDPRA